MCMHENVCVGGIDIGVRCLFQSLFSFIFETRPFIELEGPLSVQLQNPEIYQSLLPDAGLQICVMYLHFKAVSGDSNSGPYACMISTLSTEPRPRLPCPKILQTS